MLSIIDIVKKHSASERGNLLPPLHGLLYLISSNVFLYVPSHIESYHCFCYTLMSPS